MWREAESKQVGSHGIASCCFWQTLAQTAHLAPTVGVKEKGNVREEADELKKCLVSCAFTPTTAASVRSGVKKILASSAIEREKLFIKPSDLVDGVSRLSLSEQLKEQESDVVSKGVLLHTGLPVTCVRCGGRTEINGGEAGMGAVAGHVSVRWAAWEKMWASRCVCGGAWIRPSL